MSEDEKTIRVSADQALLDALRRPHERWGTEASLRLAQILALLAAGGWAFYIYATFQRENNRLALDAARQQRKQAELALQQTQLAIRKDQLEVDKLSQTPISTTERLRVFPLQATTTAPTATGSYLVTYDYTLTNSGNGRLVISPVMAEAFVARNDPAKADIVVNDVGDDGAVHWEVLSRRGYMATESWKPKIKVVNGNDEAFAEQGGAGTGPIKSGESVDGNITLLIRGKPTDFVGFRVRFTVDEGKPSESHERLRDFIPLGFSGNERKLQ